MRKHLILFSLIFVVVPCALVLFLILTREFNFADFKNLAESKMGALLRATVRVGGINVGLLDRIALTGVKISQGETNKMFYLFDVDKIVFRYRWEEIWNRRFEAPRVVSLDSPQFVFRTAVLPQALLEMVRTLAETSNFVDELSFRHGRMHFDLPYYKARFDLANLRGRLRHGKKNVWRLDGESDVNQFFRGSVRAEGIADLDTGQSVVRFFLEKLDSTRQRFLPVTGLRGVIEFTGDTINIEKIVFHYKRLPVMVKGRVTSLASPEPGLELEVSVGMANYKSVFLIKGALTGSEITGNVRLGPQSVPVAGRVALIQSDLVFRDFRIGGFSAEGELNTRTGAMHLRFEKGRERIGIQFRFKDWEIGIRLSADHIPFFGLDLVTFADFLLKPDADFWKHEKWTFDGTVNTDYLILDQTPFPEFQGSFHTTSTHIDRMQFNWAEGFQLEGSAVLEPPYVQDTRIFMDGIRLEELKSFFFRPLPGGLKGAASGEIRMRGEAKKVEVEGELTVKDGSIKGLDYQELWMRFYGMPPYLKIKESKIKKGMRTFYLDGGIDLSKQNIFQDVTAASSEKIIIWTGTELSQPEPRALDTAQGKEETESYAVGPKIKF